MYGLSAKAIEKRYSGRPLFDRVSFTLSSGDKTVLVGENGAGKTTLLRILAGVERPDKGTLDFDEWVLRRYVAQDFTGDETPQVSAYVADVDQGVVRRLLGELDFPKSAWNLRLNQLSGGQRRIVELARAFAENPDFLFLDEPENHLDYVAREWLITQIKLFTGGVCMVSHDQYVIDQVANVIIELEDGNLGTFPGSYQAYLEERNRRLEGEARQWGERQRQIKRHEAMVAMLRQRARRSDDFAKTYRSKARLLDKMKASQTDRPQLERRKIGLKAQEVDRKARKRILTLDHLTMRLGGRSLVEDVSLELVFGEKVCLFGRNGCGKSTLFRLVQDELRPTGGSVRLGVNVRVGYFAQGHEEALRGDWTPIQELQAAFNETEGRARSILSKFLFPQDAMERRICTLSGGQKTRLRFAKLFHSRPELLLLDEPTNHLDRTSWEVLVAALQDFNGTVLMISHDRSFVDAVVQKLWVFEEADIYEFLGTLSQFLEEDVND